MLCAFFYRILSSIYFSLDSIPFNIYSFQCVNLSLPFISLLLLRNVFAFSRLHLIFLLLYFSTSFSFNPTTLHLLFFFFSFITFYPIPFPTTFTLPAKSAQIQFISRQNTVCVSNFGPWSGNVLSSDEFKLPKISKKKKKNYKNQ